MQSVLFSPICTHFTDVCFYTDYANNHYEYRIIVSFHTVLYSCSVSTLPFVTAGLVKHKAHKAAGSLL